MRHCVSGRSRTHFFFLNDGYGSKDLRRGRCWSPVKVRRVKGERSGAARGYSNCTGTSGPGGEIIKALYVLMSWLTIN